MSENHSEYVHGSSPQERDRLSLLNDILNDACLTQLHLEPGESIVDFGSGLGQFTRLMASAVGPGARVVGIERDASQIAQARNLATMENQETLVEFRQGNATAAPLGADEWGSFDLAHARFLLEHVPNPERVVEQMARAIRPGGRVVIIDDDHGDFRPWPEPQGFQDIWKAYVATFEANGSDPYVGRKLVSLLAKAGLTPVRNGGVFFGGCAGDRKFEATADNLIAAFLGAKSAMLATGILNAPAFDACIDALRAWKADKSASLWYSACIAEGTAPR